MERATDLAGKTAIVTGASGGVGGAIAARLIGAGATAVLPGRSRALLESFISESGWSEGLARCHTVDLAVEADIEAFASSVTATCGSVDVLVHAAGTITPGDLESSCLGDFDLQYRLNVRAPYQLTQSLLPSLCASAGQIVFINSSAGIQARRGAIQYAATKHALRALADGVREEVNRSGVRVMSVYLGRTASRMQAAVHAHEARPYRPQLLLQPDDVAAMVVQALRLPRTAEVTDLHIRPMRKC